MREENLLNRFILAREDFVMSFFIGNKMTIKKVKKYAKK
jgi:hypothetical protein